MSSTECLEYVKEFKAYTKDINSSREKATRFFHKAGITTQSGRLNKNYYHVISKPKPSSKRSK